MRTNGWLLILADAEMDTADRQERNTHVVCPSTSHIILEGDEIREGEATLDIPIHEIALRGNWRHGWALDLHTRSSTPLPGGGFHTDHTPIGELLYQLKYYPDRSKVAPLAEIAATFLRSRLVFPYLAAILPVPPSNLTRPFQPVQEIALQIGEKTGLACPLDFLLKTKATAALKSLDDPTARREQLREAFGVRDTSLAGKYVLVFDDIYRSGETLRAVTNILLSEGKIGRVYVLTLTKTRTKR